MVLQPAMPEVHDQEGEIVENVDGRDAVVEIDAVEEARLAVEKAEIAQMQIAMAEADLAGLGAAIEMRGDICEPLTEQMVDGGLFFIRKDRARGKAGPVDVENAADIGCAALLDHRRAAMKRGHHARDIRHQRGRQFPFHGHAVEERRLIEALHFNDSIHRLARPIKRKASARVAIETAHAEIKLRRRAGIQLPLLSQAATRSSGVEKST